MIDIVTPFFVSKDSNFANSKVNSHDIYYQCIVTMFYGLTKNNNNKFNFYLFTNREVPKQFYTLLENFGVVVILTKESDIQFAACDYKPNKFPGCLFLLDSISYFKENSDNDILILDSDIYVNNIEQLEDLENLETNVGYLIERKNEEVVNGKSIENLKLDHEVIFKEKNNVKFYGGEFYYLKRKDLVKVKQEIEIIYNYYIKSRSKFTEEHIMSIVLSRLDTYSQNHKFIRRVWNSLNFDNVSGSELNYALLHMPVEKDFGFCKYFLDIANNVVKVEEHKYFNIHGNSKYRLIVNIIRKIKRRNFFNIHK